MGDDDGDRGRFAKLRRLVLGGAYWRDAANWLGGMMTTLVRLETIDINLAFLKWAVEVLGVKEVVVSALSDMAKEARGFELDSLEIGVGPTCDLSALLRLPVARERLIIRVKRDVALDHVIGVLVVALSRHNCPRERKPANLLLRAEVAASFDVDPSIGALDELCVSRLIRFEFIAYRY